MMYYGFGYDPFFGVSHILGSLLFAALVVFIIMAVVRGGPRRWQRWSSHSALSILNERFAKGEIDKAEYEERRKALTGDWK